MLADNAQQARIEMVHELHRAIYGWSVARDNNPNDVWNALLELVSEMATVHAAGIPPLFTKLTPTQFTRISWTHRNKGRVTEIVCPAHSLAVGHALTMLGMGLIEELAEDENDRCFRCEAKKMGIEARYALGLMG